MALARHPREFDVEIKVIGSRPDCKPYLRLAHVDPDGVEISNGYLGSIGHTSSLRALANQILKALGDE